MLRFFKLSRAEMTTLRSEFDLSPGISYLNNAAVAPWPRVTAEAVAGFARENATVGAQRYPEWLKLEHALRERLAWLINAPSPHDIALVKNTSEALSIIAYGLTWEAGDNVVSITQEFPSNRIVWESLARRGVESRQLDLYSSDSPEDDLIALCDPHTRLLTVSSVQYARGLRLDLNKLGAHCRAKGILFCVDAIQSLGALPFDVQTCQADFVAADGHKWMLGAEGLALLYVREAIRDRLHLHQYGWHMVEHAGHFDEAAWAPAADARRFECGSPNMLGIQALHASLGLIQHIGLDAIEAAIHTNVARCLEHIENQGLTLLSPSSRERRAGIVTFQVPDADHAHLWQLLMQHGVICAHRGGGIRFSPHFFNTAKDIDTAFNVLRQLSR